MTHTFDADVVAAVLHHMNDDHLDDNLLIVRAFAAADAVEARMTAFDGAAGEWVYVDGDGEEGSARIEWPDGAITERREVRMQIVALYDDACAKLDIEPRDHE